AARGLSPDARLAERDRLAPTHDQRERLAAPAPRGGAGGRGGASPGRVLLAGGLPGAGADRERLHARRPLHRLEAHASEAPGRAAGDRRLRYRLLVARLPQTLPD